MMVAGQGMRHQHRVRAVRVERAIGLVGDVDRRQRRAAVERERARAR
jgi:hypothetical protein